MAPLIEDYNHSFSSHDDVLIHESTRINTRRRVSFDVMVSVQEVMSRVDYTTKEKKACWFDREEMRRIKEDSRSEAKLVDSEQTRDRKLNSWILDFSGVSIRGLESRTKKGTRRKRQIRMNAYAAVFLEIDFQQQEQFIDEESIADAYFIYSDPCAKTAQMIGRQDEIEALAIHENQEAEFSGSNSCKKTDDLSTSEMFVCIDLVYNTI